MMERSTDDELVRQRTGKTIVGQEQLTRRVLSHLFLPAACRMQVRAERLLQLRDLCRVCRSTERGKRRGERDAGRGKNGKPDRLGLGLFIQEQHVSGSNSPTASFALISATPYTLTHTCQPSSSERPDSVSLVAGHKTRIPRPQPLLVCEYLSFHFL
jgi:hypothetical protein